MLGFGALKAMSDSSKYNRDLLKSGKKEPFNLGKLKKSKQETLVLKEKPYSKDLILLIRSNAQAERNKEMRNTIVILILSAAGAVGLLYSFTTFGIYKTIIPFVGVMATIVSIIALGRKNS